MQGPALNLGFAGYEVRPATSCAVMSMDRGRELGDAIDQGTATVVEHLGPITGYATFVGFFGHSVARTNQDLMAVIGAASNKVEHWIPMPAPGYGAGATLLYDSVPESEDRECWLKATGFFRALNAENKEPEVYGPRADEGAGVRLLLVDNEDCFIHTLANYARQTGAAARC